jgi:TRAP-type C4-dicarboxylate transport system permease small subunit
MPSTPPSKRSVLRAIGGVVCLVASFVVLPAGFILMVGALESSGYGSAGVTRGLAVLAAGGGLLGLGIALLIWELSVRYGVRH